VTVCALATGLAAQDDGGGGGGGGGGFAGGGSGGGSVRAATRFEQFMSRLKLDNKTQGPQVSAILQEASAQAAPVGQQMVALQNQLVAAILANKTEAELKPIVDGYTDAAAKMTGIETAAFAKIYAMLKPNQQGNAVPAFAMMAGWLQPAPASARGGGRGGAPRGGGGGGGNPGGGGDGGGQ
jgi:hypothetical protein